MSWIPGSEAQAAAAWGAFHHLRHDMAVSLREWPVAPGLCAFEIRRHLEEVFTFRDSREAADLVVEVAAMLKQATVHVTHPRYFGLYIPSVRPVSVLAEALAAQFNPQLAAWSHAPAANEIERHTLAYLITKLGLDAAIGGGCFTSGGMEANLTGLLMALNHAFPTLRESGLLGVQGRPRFYVSEEAHHSFEKAARLTGLGLASLCRVPVDATLRMDVAAVERAIERDRRDGAVPFMLVGTAGTTGSGAIDPLRALASLADAQGLWFHVDAAWGGFARLSPLHRDHLDGIHLADSVTWDAHKGLAVPLGAGMFFCREREAMARTFGLCTGYMPAAIDGTLEPYASSLQWSRRFIGLSVFMALAELGDVGFASQIEHQFRMGDTLRHYLEASGWEVVNSTPLPILCFTRSGLPTTESGLDQILAPLLARGKVWISRVLLPSKGWVLRACITSFLTDESDLKILLDELDALRRF